MRHHPSHPVGLRPASAGPPGRRKRVTARALVRRAVALVLTLCLGLFQAESLIADVCDGDASPTELVAFAGAASDLRPDSPHALAASRPATSSDAAVISAPATDLGGASGHAAHACHCVHAHGSGVLQATPPAPRHATTAHVARGVSERTPPSASLEQHLRPPVA